MGLAVFLYGPAWPHLDHLIPLAQHLSLPVCITDEDVADSAKRFYPSADIHFIDRSNAASYLVQNYSHIISCLHSTKIEELFFAAEKTLQKKIEPIWCPHGQSDKGHWSDFMILLHYERALLLYGQKMVDVLDHLGVLDKSKNVALLGNYRWTDYQKHKAFYDRQIDTLFKRLGPAEKTFLYAPTWIDSENSSSFIDVVHYLIDLLPPKINLIIKPHPNLLIQVPELFDKLRKDLFAHPHLRLLDDFPLIFPLLARTDLYIGDSSSIGYDFLRFDKPMVFLNQNHRDPETDHGLFLYRCGIHMTPDQYSQIYQKIDQMLPYDKELFSKARQEIYRYAFGDDDTCDSLQQSIEALITRRKFG